MFSCVSGVLLLILLLVVVEVVIVVEVIVVIVVEVEVVVLGDRVYFICFSLTFVFTNTNCFSEYREISVFTNKQKYIKQINKQDRIT